MKDQTDLFNDIDASEAPLRKGMKVKPVSGRHQAAQNPVSRDEVYEGWVRQLEASGRYRVLRQLAPRPIVRRAPAVTEKIAVIVDVETTGLDHSKDEVIELAIVAVTYTDDGRIGDVIDTYSSLREPSVPISPTITELTGITAEMVAGKSLNDDAVAAIVTQADLVIAHNARFDRPFCESLSPEFQHKAWACSFSEISWSELGFEGAKLGYLLGQLGWFHRGHRAVDDCLALLEVLATPVPDYPGNGFARLLEAASLSKYRIWAENSPFDLKDILKARGYRWSDGSDGRPRCWWTEVSENMRESELHFLRTEIYRRDVDVHVQRLTALDRFRRS
ncbi:3'-5' exonuclease [Dongia soli]|uniref:3'-5' exonuclease n=1 Tax=Dongia soli TaxID=600628 RepID=A0ABU5EGH7_9PROT|nr:3'-5' exonuclease [Dongia soli]MDY0885437.1 3'-5' exonuclease [Dongia soli]